MSTVLINDEYLTDIADAIRTKNSTSTAYRPKDMAAAITALSTGSSDTSTTTATTSEGVVFVDHDGTALYTYTWDEISTLTSLPELPTWTAGTEYGLEIPMTCTSWNWSLENIQSYATYGGLLTVGAVYKPTDGRTHIVYRVDTYNDAVLYFYNNDAFSSLNIDWGDSTTNASEDGEAGVVEFTHTYSESAYYDITVWGEDFYIGTGDKSIAQISSTSSYSSATLVANSIIAAFTASNEIASYSFVDCLNIREITIPDGVTSIGASAFYSCYSLTSLIIPDSVTSIEAYAFYNCYSLTSLTIPDSVTSIEAGAFYGCYSLTSLIIPDGVTSIGGSAFRYCYSLTSLIIPDGVTSIGASAFYNCYSLTSLTIPDGVTSIGTYAFYNCYSLTSLTIPDGVTSIGEYAFRFCYSLTSLTIPNSVTSIGVNAFQYCYSLASLTLSDNVTCIENYTFDSCYSLVSLTIPDGVTSIGTYAFEHCHSLTTLTIPDSVTSIGAYAFYDCYSLTSLTIPDGVTSVGTRALSCCYALTSLVISDSVTSVGTYAFYRSGLVSLDGLYIASTATSMFLGTYNLVNLTNVRYIGKDIDFSDCEKLTADSLNNIIAALCDDGEDLTLTIGDTNLAKLTDDEISVATNKGWTVV